MIKNLVIGGDSYIGGSFVNNSIFKDDIRIISRKKTSLVNEVVIADLFKIPDELFKDIDVVISFIGIAHRKEHKIQDLYYKVNRDLVFRIAKQTKYNKVKRFIQMSSISVYGQEKYIDDSVEEKPTTIYGKSKLDADKLLLSLNDDSFSVSLLRPPMIYGNKAPGNWSKLNNLVKKPIILPFKNLRNKRTFLYIKNFAIYLDYIIQENKNGVLIITDNFDLSTEEIIELMLKKNKIHRILINSQIIVFMKFIFPKQYEKIFGDLIIKSNILAPELLNKNQVLKEIIMEQDKYE